MTDDVDPRVQAGMEALQRAAREMIAASRALLDAAEDLVEDPKAAAGIVEALGSVIARAPRVPRGPRRGDAAAPGSWDGSWDGDWDRTWDDDEDGDPPVQRIPVS